MGRKGVTKDQVFETAAALRDEGLTPTVKAIQERIGGSYSCPPHLLSRRVIRQSQTPVVMHSLQKDQCRTRPEPQQCLYFFPLPQGQGALRPTFDLLAAVLG